MDKLSIEEKALLYDEALKYARIYYKNGDEDMKMMMKTCFPVLAEESEDEKIRKALVNQFNDYKRRGENHGFGYSNDKILAWLEKQERREIDDSDIATLENWENIVKENKEKWQLSDWFVEATALLIEKVKGKEIKADGNKTMLNSCINTLRNVGHQHLADWLEKQSEHKPADKVEPKFKVGDWIVYNDNVYCIYNIGLKKYYECLKIDGTVHTFDFSIDNKSHIWTIQDAKDGDVLACNEEILLFKSYSVQGRISLYCWYNGQTNNFHSKEVVDTLMTTRNKICPATKKQRDILFANMKEKGYEWNTDKKELKKIVIPIFNIGDTIIKKHNSDIHDFGSFVITDITGGKYWYNDRIICNITEQDEWEIYKYKPTKWSEEDEKILDRLITNYESGYLPPVIERDDIVKRLKSLKNRIQSQPEQGNNMGISEETKQKLKDNLNKAIEKETPESWNEFLDEQCEKKPADKIEPKQEWSENDEYILFRTISDLKFLKDTISIDPKYAVNIIDVEREINLLKSIKDRVQPQPKQEWSEEDDNCLSTIIAEFSKCAGKSVSKDEWMRCNDFLNSLKDRVQPKKEWSEDDEEIHRKCICAMRASACGFPEEEKFVEQVDNWLKSLKDRVQPQPKQEWSEEDENMLKSVIATCELAEQDRDSSPAKHLLEMQTNWLKSLKDRVQPQPKWSEEDIVAIDCAVDVLNKDLPTLAASIKRLKSLRPQNTWKPSDEQMEALDSTLQYSQVSHNSYEHLNSLFNDLKKLREE